MINWKILVRLVKKNYREFTSGKGKLTKVLNVGVMGYFGMGRIRMYGKVRLCICCNFCLCLSSIGLILLCLLILSK